MEAQLASLERQPGDGHDDGKSLPEGLFVHGRLIIAHFASQMETTVPLFTPRKTATKIEQRVEQNKGRSKSSNTDQTNSHTHT